MGIFIQRYNKIDVFLENNKKTVLPLDTKINGKKLHFISFSFGEESNGNISDSTLPYLQITLENINGEQICRDIPVSEFFSGDALTTGKYNRIFFDGEDVRLNLERCSITTLNGFGTAGNLTVMFAYDK